MKNISLILFLAAFSSLTFADSAFALGGGGGDGGVGGGGGGGSFPLPFSLSPAPATSGPFLVPASGPPSGPITMFTTNQDAGGQPNNPNNPVTTPQPGQMVPPGYFNGPPSGVPGPTSTGRWVATGVSADGSRTTWTWVEPSGVCTPTYSSCVSSPNSCGMTNTGQRNSCTNRCSAVTSAESLCSFPIDGGWSNFGSCSATACGTTGIQTRTCTNPAPSGGGANCVGSATQSCAAIPCCTPTPDCKTNQVCAGTSYTVSDNCGGTSACQGTRSCDYNWKEVAP